MSDFRDIIMQGADQRSAMWKELRLGKFTASGWGKLITEPKNKKEAEQNEGFGATACSYIKVKAMELYTGESRESDIDDQFSIRRGRILEQPAVRFYELVHDDTATITGFILYESNPEAGASPDFTSRKVGSAELKVPNNKTIHDQFLMDVHDFEGLRKFNKDYWAQVQVQLRVCGLPCGCFMSFDPRYLKSAYNELNWEGFSGEFGFENSTEHERKLALKVIYGEPDAEFNDNFDKVLERAVRLRDRYVNQLIEQFGVKTQEQ